MNDTQITLVVTTARKLRSELLRGFSPDEAQQLLAAAMPAIVAYAARA